jgi:hypothetical protein
MCPPQYTGNEAEHLPGLRYLQLLCGAEADVCSQRFSGDYNGDDEDDLSGPPGQLFVKDTEVSVVLVDGTETLKPLKKITEVTPLSNATALKPPFLSSEDAWLVETQKVRKSKKPTLVESLQKRFVYCKNRTY